MLSLLREKDLGLPELQGVLRYVSRQKSLLGINLVVDLVTQPRNVIGVTGSSFRISSNLFGDSFDSFGVWTGHFFLSVSYGFLTRICTKVPERTLSARAPELSDV